MTDKAGTKRRDRNAIRGKSMSHGRKKPFRYYIVILSVLALLITAAFFAPQILFQVQDAILCGDTVLAQQESMNVEALSTTYEQSLAVRMQNYAEGLEAGNTFYVTSQSLEKTDEVSDFIYSGQGIYGDIISSFIDIGLVSPYIWEMGYVIGDCKQYVIYSDDFTKGVNFILWYVEMKGDNGSVIKLLADAEDRTIYAVKTEGNSYEALPEGEMGRNYIDEIFWSDAMATSMWGFYAMAYQALDETEEKNFEIMVNEYGWSGDGLMNSAGSAVNMEEDGVEIVDEDYIKRKEEERGEIFSSHEEWADIQEKVRYYMWGEDSMFFLLPYGEAKLDVVLKIPVLKDSGMYIYGSPDMTMGIRQIYEMIPEFA